MPKSLTPLGGYNNNVTHKGRVYHVQTEDSGAQYARIVTHLFADGGRIIKTARSDYSAHVDADDAPVRIRELMQRQHRAMYAALRGGYFDELLDALPTPSISAPAPPAARGEALSLSVPPLPPLPAAERAERPSARHGTAVKPELPATKTSSRPPRRKSSSPPRQTRPAASDSDAGLHKAATSATPEAQPRRVRSEGSSRPPTVPAKRRARQSPLSFSVPPAARASIFGETGADERPLDDAILSYLRAGTDDLD